MTDWYKMNPVDWNEGTNGLSLEQEAAYLRICNAIYIAGGPIANNPFVVAGLLRCNDRKAKRLVSELVEAGKVTVEDGSICNRRALDEVSVRSRLSVERKSAGSRGGVESAKARANPLENKDTGQASASTENEPDKRREEERREEEKEGSAGAPGEYAFVGNVIRLKASDFERWSEAFWSIPDLKAELAKADAYYAENPVPNGKWFFPVSKWLEREHRKAAQAKAAITDWRKDPLYAGAL